MKKRAKSDLFRDWFFERLIWALESGTWIIKIRDFKKSRKKSEHDTIGLTAPSFYRDGGTIYLDKDEGTSQILVHELGHVVLGEIIDNEARDRNKSRREIKDWSEEQVLIFEDLFYKCLSVQQKMILEAFVAKAKEGYLSRH